MSRDPSFFQAFCQLSQTHGLLYSYGFDHTLSAARIGRSGISERPLVSVPTLAKRIWRVRENLYVGYRDYDAALG